MKLNLPLRNSRKAQMSADRPSVTTYAALHKQVQEVLLLGQRKIEQAKVQTYSDASPDVYCRGWDRSADPPKGASELRKNRCHGR